MTPEPRRVASTCVQRQPRNWPLAASRPVGQERRLAEPGWGTHQDQPALPGPDRAGPPGATGLGTQARARVYTVSSPIFRLPSPHTGQPEIFRMSR
jgi:hypothetical protein